MIYENSISPFYTFFPMKIQNKWISFWNLITKLSFMINLNFVSLSEDVFIAEENESGVELCFMTY